MIIGNPYRPGAGLMPGYLAGREELISNAGSMFESLKNKIPVQSIAYTGYRGVGKTVLLNRLQEISGEYGISGFHIEVTKSGSFIAKLSDNCRVYLRNNSVSEKLKGLFKKAVDALKSIELSYKPGNSEFSVSMQERILYTNSDAAQGLQELFEAIGGIAAEKNRPICFFIDEFQYAKQSEMDAFVSALHRASQLAYPVMAVCAGTPEMIKMLYKEKTYVERLFIFPKLGLLTESQVGDAIVIPGEKVKLSFDETAVERIALITGGYPYFVQQYGQIICSHAGENMLVDETAVNDVLPEYYKELDNNFYMIRYQERGELEKQCLQAIADADSLPCNVSYIAKTLGKNPRQVSPSLSRLKNKGLITYESASEIDFTVPGFGDYIKRNRQQ